jgi:SAM-dependent methyltransferase
VRLSEGRDRLHQIGGSYYVAECRVCGLWFQNPRPESRELGSLYPADYRPYCEPLPAGHLPPLRPSTARYLVRALGYPADLAAGAASRDWRSPRAFDRLRRWRLGTNLVPRYVADGRLLEVGCASGGRLVELRRLGWKRLEGIELDPDAAAIARRQGFAVECGRVEDALEHYADETFDVIIASMVIEHLVNPFETVRRIASRLKAGGQFLFSTVNRDSLDASVYGTYWRNLDLPRHMVWFRKRDIHDMLAPDFEEIACFFQAAPIDLVGSALYRRREQKKALDRILIGLGESKVRYLSLVLALAGRSSRMSVSCVRRHERGRRAGARS